MDLLLCEFKQVPLFREQLGDFQSGEWVDAFAEEVEEAYWMQNLPHLNALNFLQGTFAFLGKLDFWLMKIPPHGKIRWHIDHNREASLVFPLSPGCSVRFLQGDDLIEYFYRDLPILLNVKQKHQVLNDSEEDRIALYSSIFDHTYEQAKKQLHHKGFLN